MLTGHSGLLGARRACEIVADLAEALAHAHRQGIVHRDVKPENIQLDHHGHAYLIDFGIACQAESGEFSVETGCTLTGTPAYLAPELAHGEHAVALPSSDQYSLGAVFYELLCGRTPFSGPSLYVLYQAANQKPPSPRSINPTIPPPNWRRSVSKRCPRAPTGAILHVIIYPRVSGAGWMPQAKNRNSDPPESWMLQAEASSGALASGGLDAISQ